MTNKDLIKKYSGILFAIILFFVLNALLASYIGNWVDSLNILPNRVGWGITMFLSWILGFVGMYFFLKSKKLI